MKRTFFVFMSTVSYGYFLALLTILYLLYSTGDSLWFTTLLLFGPRWTLLIPILILLPINCWINRKLITTQIISIVIILWPVMNFEFNVSQNNRQYNQVLRVLSCNIGGKSFDLKKFKSLINNLNIDIVILQEWDNKFLNVFPLEWNKFQFKSHIIASKYKMSDKIISYENFADYNLIKNCIVTCIIQTPWKNIYINSIHFPSPRVPLVNMLDKKTLINFAERKNLNLASEKRKKVSEIASSIIADQSKFAIIAGDFNTPVESRIFQNHWKDLNDAFSDTGFGYGWTLRDSLRGIPIDVRVDHILTKKGMTPLVCEIGPDVGAEHRPIIADILIETN